MIRPRQPAEIAQLGDAGTAFGTGRIVESLLLAVVGPMSVAVALLLNLVGYAGGWVATKPLTRAERIAGLFSVGMRDFAVAVGLLVSAGVPAAAALPAVVFGVVEMATSAALVRWLQKSTS